MVRTVLFLRYSVAKNRRAFVVRCCSSLTDSLAGLSTAGCPSHRNLIKGERKGNAIFRCCAASHPAGLGEHHFGRGQ